MYPFGTVTDIANGIPDPAEHPKLKSSGREDGLLETPDHRPTVRGMSGNMRRVVKTKKTNIVRIYGMLSRVFAWAPRNDASASGHTTRANRNLR